MERKNVQQEKRAVEIPPLKEFLKQLRGERWMYIRTVVDVVRQPILILDKDLRILAANETSPSRNRLIHRIKK